MHVANRGGVLDSPGQLLMPETAIGFLAIFLGAIFVTATLCAAVGHGGALGYLAILALAGLSAGSLRKILGGVLLLAGVRIGLA